MFGWLARAPGTASGQPDRPPVRRTGRLVPFFVFESLVLFVILEALQLAGVGIGSSFMAGLVGGVAGAAGSILFLKGEDRKRMPAEANQVHNKWGGL